MSYILDALKRADADRERERAEVPGLHAQPFDFDEVDAEPPRAMAVPWRWIGAGASVAAVVMAAVAWLLWGRDGMPLAAAPPQATVATTAPVPSKTMNEPAVAPAPAPAPAPAGRAPRAERPSAVLHPPAATIIEAPAAKSKAAATAQQTPDEPAPSASAVRVYRVNELPENIRNSLPKLTLGGAMYSPKPASRMLIINGQVFHEGDTLGPELSLVQIRLKEAVLEYKGHRYEVSY